MELLVLVAVFVLLFVLGVPIAFCIGTATLASFLMAIDFLPAVTTVTLPRAAGSPAGSVRSALGMWNVRATGL